MTENEFHKTISWENKNAESSPVKPLILIVDDDEKYKESLEKG